MPYLWDDTAWLDYQYWLTQDKKTVKKINTLLKDLARTGGRWYWEGRVPQGR